jgi:hypothetical protein
MTATTLDDTLTSDEFALRNETSVETRYRHLDRHRRVRVGSAVTVVFEDRDTLWFRIQELAGFARSRPAGSVRKQIDWYHRLMPGNGRLTAAVWIAARGRAEVVEKVRTAVADGRLVLRSDAGHEVIGRYLPERVTDRLIGLVRWAEFDFSARLREVLHDPTTGWDLAVEADGLVFGPTRLSEAVLESLSADMG